MRTSPRPSSSLLVRCRRSGLWEGENTRQEHQREARRLGSPEAYRLSLCNALLGAV
ncbi:MAG: DUF6245 family protein [Solirubrobacteraceae bacterium]